MKIYKTQEAVERDIKDGVLTIQGDVKFECDINIDADIKARDIKALDIEANNINARNIFANNIKALNINVNNIIAWDIFALDIFAGDIKAWDINANNINYWALCLAYNSIKCKGWKAGRDSHKEPICLDGELIIKDDKVEELTIKQVCKEIGRNIKIKK